MPTARRRTRVLSQTLLCTEVPLTIEYDDIIQYSLSDIMYAPLLPPTRDKYPTHLKLFDASPWPSDELRNILRSYGKKWLAPRPKAKVEEHFNGCSRLFMQHIRRFPQCLEAVLSF